MTRSVTRYRFVQFEAHPNTASWVDHATRDDAEIGSALLAATIERAGLKLPPSPERRRLTFEEQLAAVEQGKARIVEALRVANEPEYTLAGVTPWGSF